MTRLIEQTIWAFKECIYNESMLNIFKSSNLTIIIKCKNDSPGRVRTDLERALSKTLVLENSWNLKKGAFCPEIVLEFCKIILEI